MTYKELQDEVIASRFRDGQRDRVKRWINMRYQQIVSAADWPWQTTFSTVTVANGTNVELIDLGSDFSFDRVLMVVNADSNLALQYIDPNEFFVLPEVVEGSTGEPSRYTTLAGIDLQSGVKMFLYLDSLAGGDFAVTGRLRWHELANDNDSPVLPVSYHYMLVLGAVSTGLKLENDPTWEALETEYMLMLNQLKDEYLPPNQPEPRQFGREPFDVWQ